ncbi:type II toxin-antitoxin system VapC family toxin [Candidatus Nitrospira salsa]
MKLLLDTHVFLWWMGDHQSPTAKAASAIKDGKNAVYVNAVTAWEISIKKALGKLKLLMN